MFFLRYIKSSPSYGETIKHKLYKLFKSFCRSKRDTNLVINCLYFQNDYHPENGDEVATYIYKFHIVINDVLYVYDGWCYPDDIESIAIGIFSHWLLNNCKIYTGPCTAWHNMYVGACNIIDKKPN